MATTGDADEIPSEPLFRLGVVQPWPLWFSRAEPVTVAANGTAYLADTGNYRVTALHLTGNTAIAPVTSWAGRGRWEGQLYGPYDIEAAPDSTVYAADYPSLEGLDCLACRIQRFTASGRFLLAWVTSAGPMAVGPDSTVYVGDRYAAEAMIRRFTADGRLIAEWPVSH